MSNVGGVNVIILVFIVSFAIDRLVNGVLFAMTFLEAWNRKFPEPKTVQDHAERVRAENIRKLAYVAFAAVPAIPVLAYFGKGIT